MADKTWKAFERVAAKFFGCTRAPLSGGNGKQTRSDSLHEDFFISCKYSKRLALDSLYQEENEKAEKENKIPILCLKKKGMTGFYIVVHSNDFHDIKRLTSGEETIGKESSET